MPRAVWLEEDLTSEHVRFLREKCRYVGDFGNYCHENPDDPQCAVYARYYYRDDTIIVDKHGSVDVYVCKE